MKIRLLLILLVAIIVASCSSSKKIQTLKPEADLAAPILYDKELSYLNIPISIKLKDLAFQTNSILTGLIYEDGILEDDNLMMKVWKQAPIEITDSKGKIKVVLPLKVWAKVRYGSTVFGMDLYDTRELNFNGVVTLLGEAKFTNWQLSAKSTVQSVVWKESPSVTIAGRSVPITYLINPAMSYFKTTMEQKIDAAIAKSLNFQDYVLDALEKVSAPVNVHEGYDTWFKIKPLGLNATEAILNKDVVSMNLEMACFMESFIGKPAYETFNKEAIQLRLVDKMKDKFSASLIVVSPYLKASEVMTKNFQNKEFSSGSKKVTIQKVDLWHKNGKVVIALTMNGSLNGTVYLSGIPKYNNVDELIYFDNLNYVLETKSKLMKTANWLAQGIILKKIQAYTSYSIKPELEMAKNQMSQYLNNYSPAKGILINGKVDPIVIKNIQLTDQAMVVTIGTTGNLDLKINGLQ
ncbi:DUF4403 family protein [Lutibacter sp.]|uniref:DUF4403 family protein n=1 Tax=Lutibacter sp. TaxID=1925666 RepID=UPI001A291106|nr:DUF4403 family protein [Lutibacter sp.]MBI9040971.1 DUF4403 family protein [Lutibacter sp.]